MDKYNENGSNGIHSDPTTKEKGLFRRLFVVFIILLIDLVAFAAILPLLPSILDFYDRRNALENGDNQDFPLSTLHDLISRTKQIFNIPDTRRYNNVLIGGFLGSLYSMLQFLINPISGGLSDVFGRKPILLISMIGTAVSYYVWLSSETFSMFLLSRVLSGISKASVTVSTAVVTDLSTSKTRGKGMALVGVAFSFGFIVGPLLGAYFAGKAMATAYVDVNPFIMPAKLCLIMQIIDVLIVFFCFNESLAADKRKPLATCLKSSLALLNPLNFFSSSLTTSKGSGHTVRQLCFIHFVYLLLFSGLEFTLTFLTHERFAFESSQQGKLFLFIGLIMILTQGGYVRRAKPGQEKSIISCGMIALIPGMAVVGLAQNNVLLYAGLLLFSFGAATVVSLLTTMFTNEGPGSCTGELLGLFRSSGALARAIGPLLTCAVYWSIGSQMCYLIGAGLFVIPLFLLSKVNTTAKRD